MDKITILKQKLLCSGKPELWISFIILAGIFIKLVLPSDHFALAEQSVKPDYSLISVEAIQAPDWSRMTATSDDDNLILADNNYIQSICFLGGICDNLVSPTSSALALTESTNKSVEDLRRVIVTAYSSTPDQTDSTPFITANGTYVYDGLVACNFLPFHTKVKFPEVYGDKIFIVEDRMAKKNSYKMDIWMPTREAALQFGVKKIAVEIVN